MKFIRANGPHGPHHLPRHRRHHGHSESILRMVLDLADHGVPAEDLHKAIDQELRTKVSKEQRSRIDELDPGCGTPEEPINPFTRAAALESEIRRLGDQTARELSKQHVVVAGEFPPHILDYLLDRPGSRITRFTRRGRTGSCRRTSAIWRRAGWSASPVSRSWLTSKPRCSCSRRSRTATRCWCRRMCRSRCASSAKRGFWSWPPRIVRRT
jgi:hypothetical protein